MLDAHLPARLNRALLDAVEAANYPHVIRLARQRRGLTQEQLGELTGYSAATISRLETGRQPLHDIATLRSLSTALDIPPTWLGLADKVRDRVTQHALDSAFTCPTSPQATRVMLSAAGEEPIVKRRQFLVSVAGPALLSTATGPLNETIANRLERMLTGTTAAPAPPASLAGLTTQLGTARSALAAASYTSLSAMLPPLVQAAEAVAADATGRRRDQAHALLAHAYVLAAQLATKAHTDAVAWVAADRALRAARTSGDVLAEAAAARQVAIAMRRQGRHTSATDLLVDTAVRLDAEAGHAGPAVLAGYTSMLCTAAYASAQGGKNRQAEEYISEAALAVRRLADPPAPFNGPTTATVEVYQIGVHNALGEPGTALHHASKVDPTLLPTAERYARYCIDTARAWHAYGNRDRAVDTLLAAEQAAPEEVRRPSVVALISTMRYEPGPVPSALHALATRTSAA
ncbi:helix-turn-helix transcriptional regulator [Nonomuraea sp. NPDC049504]|uniref:helix-turn-helix domain-containing protein n=1 Tax=Nonomuraea sp. NPDC049504 TaxID=3154729 RepID=UPI003437C733